MTEPTARVRVPDRFFTWLSGSQVWDQPDSDVIASLVEKLKAAKPRKDRSTLIHVTLAEAEELAEWGDYFAGSSVDIAREDADGRADLNAGRATVRQARKAVEQLTTT